MEKEPIDVNGTGGVIPAPLPYHDPTPGEIPIVGMHLSQGDKFVVNMERDEKGENIPLQPDYDFVPCVPEEPENPLELDDRQNVLNFMAAGCNLATEVVSLGELNKHNLFTYCYGKVGLLIGVSRLKERTAYFTAFMDEITPGHPNSYDISVIKGFHIEDEPSLDEITADPEPDPEDLTGIPQSLLQIYRRLANKLAATPSMHYIGYINLLPLHHFDDYKSSVPAADSFQNYLDTYQMLYHPSFYSYDQYPFLQFNPLLSKRDFFNLFTHLEPGEVVHSHESFYRSMEMVSEQARKHDRPFWAYLCTTEYFNSYNYTPVPLEQYLRYEAFTALAYGARGLCLWRFMQNNDDSQNLFEKGRDGQLVTQLRTPINEDRTRSPFWYYARRVFREIKRFQNIFLTTEVKGVYHTYPERLINLAARLYPHSSRIQTPGVRYGESEVSVQKMNKWGLNNFLSDSIPVIEEVSSGDDGLGVVVSHLADKPVQQSGTNGWTLPDPVVNYCNHYAMIVNHDALCYQDISIRLKGNVKIYELTQQRTGESHPDDPIQTSGNTSVQRTLPPGGYLILKWTERFGIN